MVFVSSCVIQVSGARSPASKDQQRTSRLLQPHPSTVSDQRVETSVETFYQRKIIIVGHFRLLWTSTEEIAWQQRKNLLPWLLIGAEIGHRAQKQSSNPDSTISGGTLTESKAEKRESHRSRWILGRREREERDSIGKP